MLFFNTYWMYEKSWSRFCENLDLTLVLNDIQQDYFAIKHEKDIVYS